MSEIKLNSTAAGPEGVWHPGVHKVSEQFATDLVAGKFAEHAVVKPPEKAVVAPAEKAVVKPPEKATIPAGTSLATPPASWGKGVGK